MLYNNKQILVLYNMIYNDKHFHDIRFHISYYIRQCIIITHIFVIQENVFLIIRHDI